MRTLLANKTKHYKNFAEAVNRLYRGIRYGVESCKPDADLDLFMIRKEMVDWQEDEDGAALTQTSIQYQTWLAVNYDDTLYPSGGTGYIHTSSQTGPLGLNYINQTIQNGQNVIEINSGGCITKINLNPAITVNQGSAGSQYSYHQSVASATWTINHNLAFVPNVTTVNESGTEIIGVVTTLNSVTAVIEFSDAVAGYAYLS
jgi:hypothetical protein